MSQSLVEKIVQRYAVDLAEDREVHAGDFVTIRPKHVMTHDNTAAVIPKFRSTGAPGVRHPGQPVFCLDHDIQNRSDANLRKYREIEAFARDNGVSFFGAGRGIGHQIMVEEGFAVPGSLVVGSDSHSNFYGALGALGTPVVRTDAAAIWATGQTWWQVPDVVKVELTGKLRPGVTGKDVIITLIGTFNDDEVLNCCVEFTGPGVASLSMEQRMTLSNMTTEWGALAGVFPIDEVTRSYLQARADVMAGRGDEAPRLSRESIETLTAAGLAADADAGYVRVIHLDLGAVTPHVAGPDEVKRIVPLSRIEKEGIAIQKAFLLSCVNGRLGDFAEAAEVLKDRKVSVGVELYIAAASSEVEEEATRLGYWQTLLDAGARALPAGCGPCIGLGEGLLQDGETGISATNRNFKGRMGSREAHVYLASPAVVAASAVAGRIAGVAGVGDQGGETDLKSASRIVESPVPARESLETEILDGFPERIEGELLYVPKDNMNTDGIYGKDVTYKEGLTRDEMAAAAMLNYDPRFQEIAREGDILVGGLNFGSGSSREQAATCLAYRGLRMVVAGSYSQTYKRNAFNNGYVVIECPELVADLKTRFAGSADLTIRTGSRAVIDFRQATIRTGDHLYSFAPLGEVAQQLVIFGGLEALVRHQLAAAATSVADSTTP